MGLKISKLQIIFADWLSNLNSLNSQIFSLLPYIYTTKMDRCLRAFSAQKSRKKIKSSAKNRFNSPNEPGSVFQLKKVQQPRWSFSRLRASIGYLEGGSDAGDSQKKSLIAEMNLEKEGSRKGGLQRCSLVGVRSRVVELGP